MENEDYDALSDAVRGVLATDAISDMRKAKPEFADGRSYTDDETEEDAAVIRVGSADKIIDGVRISLTVTETFPNREEYQNDNRSHRSFSIHVKSTVDTSAPFEIITETDSGPDYGYTIDKIDYVQLERGNTVAFHEWFATFREYFIA